ncbi:MAG: ParA family protein [Armatimonadota bacterium]|jgi:chromosome partitioning protein
MGACFAIVNQKGGVGKTTTAVNVAAAAAARGIRTLLVDLDAQGNATAGLGIDRSELRHCVYDVLVGGVQGPVARTEDVVITCSVPQLDLIPATINLAGTDLTLASQIARETRLRDSLEQIRADYDLILIDTAPSLGILTINSLVAANAALIPIQCEYYALEGLSQLMQVIELVQRNLNPALRIHGVVLTMYDSRTTLSRDVATEVRKHFGSRVFNALIPRNVRLAEAPSHGVPAILYAPGSTGARAYVDLCREVLEDVQEGTRPRP